MATHVCVDYDTYSYITVESDPDDEWSRDSTAADIYINGLHVVSNHNYRDITVSFDVEPGKMYWLVWADYGTGDSFGRDDNKVEFVDLFINEEMAQAAAKSVELNGKWIRQDGAKGMMYVPWEGYFEHLNSINVQGVKILK
jgi:hypothetical protein